MTLTLITDLSQLPSSQLQGFIADTLAEVETWARRIGAKQVWYYQGDKVITAMAEPRRVVSSDG